MSEPKLIQRKAGNTTVNVCSECGNLVGPPASYQAEDNQIYVRQRCVNCGQVYNLKGPFRSHAEANPVSFGG